MEKLYFVKSIEISSRSVAKGDQTRVTPNFTNLKLSFESLNEFAKLAFDNILNPEYKLELGNNSTIPVIEDSKLMESNKRGTGISLNISYTF